MIYIEMYLVVVFIVLLYTLTTSYFEYKKGRGVGQLKKAVEELKDSTSYLCLQIGRPLGTFIVAILTVVILFGWVFVLPFRNLKRLITK